MVSQTTEGIHVQVSCKYLEEQSNPRERYFFFRYDVEISNKGNLPAQLVNRHWEITDGMGQIDVVDGPGVVGEQPFLRPGESFVYNSFCPLPTPTGSMKGHYEMVREDGTRFNALIPTFLLVEPSSFN